MIHKLRRYFENGCYRSLDTYADTIIESIVLNFLLMCWKLLYGIGLILLFVTCPLWIIPYCIYKSRKKV